MPRARRDHRGTICARCRGTRRRLRARRRQRRSRARTRGRRRCSNARRSATDSRRAGGSRASARRRRRRAAPSRRSSGVPLDRSMREARAQARAAKPIRTCARTMPLRAAAGRHARATAPRRRNAGRGSRRSRCAPEAPDAGGARARAANACAPTSASRSCHRTRDGARVAGARRRHRSARDRACSGTPARHWRARSGRSGTRWQRRRTAWEAAWEWRNDASGASRSPYATATLGKALCDGRFRHRRHRLRRTGADPGAAAPWSPGLRAGASGSLARVPPGAVAVIGDALGRRWVRQRDWPRGATLVSSRQDTPLVEAVEHPPQMGGVRIVDVPAIRAAAAD